VARFPSKRLLKSKVNPEYEMTMHSRKAELGQMTPITQLVAARALLPSPVSTQTSNKADFQTLNTAHRQKLCHVTHSATVAFKLPNLRVRIGATCEVSQVHPDTQVHFFNVARAHEARSGRPAFDGRTNFTGKTCR
jgi:hypothetical protein